MRAGLDPFRFLLIAMAGSVTQQQQHAIAYLARLARLARVSHNLGVGLKAER